MKRGRPKSGQTVKVIQVKLRLYEGGDDDLIAFFSHIPPRLRATMVKQALRSGVFTAPTTDQDDMFDSLDSLVN